jgi:hypothetical protein
MDHGQRIELLTGRSLDNCKDILDFPAAETHCLP